MGTEYRIGAFADMGGVSAKTLRFYDEIGLLRPARVDPRTRYRFYRPEQLAHLAAIVELQRAGMSLAEIQRLGRTTGLEGHWLQTLSDLKKATERNVERALQSL